MAALDSEQSLMDGYGWADRTPDFENRGASSNDP